MAMRPRMKWLMAEAWFTLGWARILKALPFSRLAPLLGRRMEETPLVRQKQHERTVLEISKAIHLVSRNTWWESKCMVTAIAGMQMLKRRGIESTLYMGTGRGEDGQMIAHAWLRSGMIYVTGAEGIEKVAVVATFSRTMAEPDLRRSMTNG
jgi:hypothetical protein